LDFLTFSTKVPLRFVTYLQKVPKIEKKFFWSSHRFIIGRNFLGHALYKSPNFFIHNMDFMGIKRRRIWRRFQKYKLALVTKCTQRKVFENEEFLYYSGVPLCTDENLYPGISFLVHFVSKISLYLWNLCKILNLLIPTKTILWKLILDLYIVHDPKCFDQLWRNHLVKTLFVYFHYFWKVCNKPLGYFCPSSNINPP
jgi:hypothetical protein